MRDEAERNLIMSFAASKGLRFLGETVPLSLAMSLVAGAEKGLTAYAATERLSRGRRTTVAHLSSDRLSMSVVLVRLDPRRAAARVLRCRQRDGSLITGGSPALSEAEVQRQLGTHWSAVTTKGLRAGRRYDVSANLAGTDAFRAVPVAALRSAPSAVSFEVIGSELCVNQVHRLASSASRRPAASAAGLSLLWDFSQQLAERIDAAPVTSRR